MKLTKLYNPDLGIMNVAGLMSGSGTNLVKIMEYQHAHNPNFRIKMVFSDNADSNAARIGSIYGIYLCLRDYRTFCSRKRADWRDMDVRAEYDRETVEVLRKYGITTVACAGYMLKETPVLVHAFLNVNIHPADLSILDGQGKRKYPGDHAVRDAILAGEQYLRSTTHIVTEEVDAGPILMVSSGLEVQLPDDFDPENRELVDKIADEHQNRLKEKGDWFIFPKTLEYIAEGRYATDVNGNIYFDENPIPNGLRLD